MNNHYGGFSIVTVCVCVCVYVCMSWRAGAMNELLNHTIDQFFLSDTSKDLGQLNGLFRGSGCIP